MIDYRVDKVAHVLRTNNIIRIGSIILSLCVLIAAIILDVSQITEFELLSHFLFPILYVLFFFMNSENIMIELCIDSVLTHNCDPISYYQIKVHNPTLLLKQKQQVTAECCFYIGCFQEAINLSRLYLISNPQSNRDSRQMALYMMRALFLAGRVDECRVFMVSYGHLLNKKTDERAFLTLYMNNDFLHAFELVSVMLRKKWLTDIDRSRLYYYEGLVLYTLGDYAAATRAWQRIAEIDNKTVFYRLSCENIATKQNAQ